MGRVYKTAMGQSLDMSILRAKNERERAVGNMNVNARGDIIDSNNQVINDNNKRINQMYQKTMNSEAVARARAKQEEQERQRLLAQQAQAAPAKTRGKARKETELTDQEQQDFEDFNQPNPKK